ncbi:MAG: hypothetical protein FWH35_00475, partial [Treponema sp.]|nr:hypothetical protein [Treponema sp.]
MNKVQAFRLLFFAVFSLFFLGCSGGTYSIVPGEGVSVPGITALAFNNGGDSFVSLDENGSIRIWDVYSGSSRLLEEGGELQDFPFEAAIGGEVGLSSAASSGIRQEFPVFSPDGAKKLFPAKDGSIILADAVSGNELARYYGFGSVDEWVSLVPEAYYNASFLGSSYLAIETRNRRLKLGQLSGFLFRPDLFYASMLGGGSFNQKAMMPAFLMDLLNKNQAPPEVSLSMEKGNLKIKVIEQKGGTGHVALFRRSAGREIPFGLFDAEEKAASKYPERGKTCYEIIVEPGFLTGEIGVSAFNKTNTVESETTWIALPGLTAISLEQSPSFLALLVSESEEDINALEGILSLQNGGELYSTAEIVKYFGSDFSKDSFLKALENLRPGGESRLSGSPAGYGMGSGNTILFYLGGRGYAGPNGDLLIVPWNAAGEISGDDILKALSGFFPNVVLLLDLEPALPL